MTFHRKAFGLAFLLTLSLWAIGWALTVDQIWSSVYDSSNTALRVNQVAP